MEKKKFGKVGRSQSNFEQDLQPKFASQNFDISQDARVTKDQEQILESFNDYFSSYDES